MISWEWVVVGIAALLLFGGRRLPQFAKDLGSGIKAFRKALTESDDESQPKKIQSSRYGYDTPPPNYHQPDNTQEQSSKQEQKPQQETKTKVEEAVVVNDETKK
jgi:sec-independent protein translocase protein TatA